MAVKQLNAHIGLTDTDIDADTDTPAITKPVPEALKALYFANYSALHGIVYDTDTGRVLSPVDGDSILALLGEALPAYKRRVTQRAYIRWATDFVIIQTHRFVNALVISRTHRGIIQAAIWREMPEFIFDSSLQMGDLEQDVFIQILGNANDLADINNPKHTAKQSSRVYGVAKKHIYYYFSGKMSDRLHLLLGRVAQGESLYGDIETMSRAEYKAIKAAGKRKLAA